MIDTNKLEELREFLKSNPQPKVYTASTLKSGCFSLIKPIPTICGAEIICAQDAYSDVINEVIRW